MMERRIEIDGERWDDVAEEGKMGPRMAGKFWLPRAIPSAEVPELIAR